MTTDNATDNAVSPLDVDRTASKICDLAASIADICDEGIGEHTEITTAHLVALRAMAGNIGALADRLGDGQYRGNALEWIRTT